LGLEGEEGGPANPNGTAGGPKEGETCTNPTLPGGGQESGEIFTNGEWVKNGGGGKIGGNLENVDIITTKTSGSPENLQSKSMNLPASSGDEGLKTIAFDAYMAGMTNAVTSNNAFGIGYTNPADYSNSEFRNRLFAQGQLAGNAITMASGTAEMAQGTGIAAGGMAAAATGGGVVVAAVGALEVAHGSSAISIATANSIKATAYLNATSNHNGNGGSEEGLEGSGDNSNLESSGTKPTPETNPNDFTKLKGDQGYVHKKTGEIYKKSYTSHGNKNNTGTQWKIYPKGTKSFGKQTGKRTTVDGKGNIIGN
jgi:hypothetical protein